MSILQHITVPRVVGGAVLIVPTAWLIKHLACDVGRWFKYQAFPQWFSSAIDYCSVLHADTLRQAFRNVSFDDIREFPSRHSHPQAAGDRSVCDCAINRLCSLSGFAPYSVSMSGADERNGVLGSRAIYTGKDALSHSRFDSLEGRQIALKMIDVDYYVDMPYYMLKGLPMFLYTFVPLRVSGSVPDGVYTITGDQVDMKVHGEARYQHPLWDYGSDHLVVSSWWKTVVYAVEGIISPNDVNRRLIALIPRRTVYGILGWFLPGKRLGRRKISHGGWNISNYIRTDKKVTSEFVSIGRVGQSHSVVAPAVVVTAMFGKVTRAKNSAPVGGSEMILRAHAQAQFYPIWAKECNPCLDAQMWVSAFEQVPALFTAYQNKITVPEPVSCHFTVVHPEHLMEEVKPTMREVFEGVKPWSREIAVPTRCVANDRAAIAGRIETVRNEVVPPPNFTALAAELINGLVGPLRGTGVPMSLEAVRERQNRPTQVRIFDINVNHMGYTIKTIVSSFQKVEAYSKVTDPRNISTICADVKIRYSPYTYQLAESVFYPLACYGPSKTPLAIAERVTEILVGADFVIPTDFSRFDGTHSKWLCDVERMLLKAFFAEQYHDEVVRLYDSQFQTTGFTGTGQRYETGFSRLSGSPETSLFNSFDNMLVAYIALRITRKMTHDQAFKQLGIYCGDDGLTVGVNQASYMRIARKIGLTIKAGLVRRDEPVPFLSRLFLECWQGGYGSITEPLRQTSKLHLTGSAAGVPATVVCYRRAIGYLLTDPETPFLKHWALAVVRIVSRPPDLEKYAQELQQDERWFEQYDRSQNFPAPGDQDNTYTVAAQYLGVSTETLTLVCEELDRVTRREDLQAVFRGTLFGGALNVTLPAIVGDTVVIPPGGIDFVPSHPTIESLVNQAG